MCGAWASPLRARTHARYNASTIEDAAMVCTQRLLVPITRSVVLLCLIAAVRVLVAAAEPPVKVPRIESVVPLARQPHEDDPATIWYDDFNDPDKPYGEADGKLDEAESFG